MKQLGAFFVIVAVGIAAVGFAVSVYRPAVTDGTPVILIANPKYGPRVPLFSRGNADAMMDLCALEDAEKVRRAYSEADVQVEPGTHAVDVGLEMLPPYTLPNGEVLDSVWTPLVAVPRSRGGGTEVFLALPSCIRPR